MTIKEIRNESDGNNIEAIIFNRIKRHVFMLYPFADIRISIISVLNEKKYQSGIYVFLISDELDMFMRIPDDFLIKMITQQFYNPFFEEPLRKLLKTYIEEIENYKKRTKADTRKADKWQKPHWYIKIKQEKQGLLKRLLGGLKLW